MSKVEKNHATETKELIRYVKEEDPETCINILYVISQCKIEDAEAPRRKRKNFQID